MEQKKTKSIRKIVQIDEELCNGCGECIPSCAEGALRIVNGKAKLVSDTFCDGLGACLGDCPQGAIQIIEREASEFDEEEVRKQLGNPAHVHAHAEPAPAAPAPTVEPVPQSPGTNPAPEMPCGCPGSMMRQFSTPPVESEKAATGPTDPIRSTLTHWPVQIRLVPPTAPFLRSADLLVVADCVPFAFPTLHQDFLKNRVVMIGCPKFDDVQGYMQKFTEIFKSAGVKSVTVLSMEVPCCSGIQMVVTQALAQSGQPIPYERVVISLQGQVLRREMVGHGA